MDSSQQQRRAFIALLCKMAWADGVVSDEEREHIKTTLTRVAADAVTAEELGSWLRDGVPEGPIEVLPPDLNLLFVLEATALMSVDGSIDAREREMLESLIHRASDDPPDSTPIAELDLTRDES
jgi:uncharacterized membrane protein YebE (DUF533 family)